MKPPLEVLRVIPTKRQVLYASNEDTMTIRAVGTRAVPAGPALSEWLGWEELETHSFYVSVYLPLFLGSLLDHSSTLETLE